MSLTRLTVRLIVKLMQLQPSLLQWINCFDEALGPKSKHRTPLGLHRELQQSLICAQWVPLRFRRRAIYYSVVFLALLL